MNKKFSTLSKVSLFIALILILASAIIFITIPEMPKRQVKQQSAPDVSMNYTGPKIGGDFILVDQNNQKVDSKQFRGKYQLIYFGFTFCPDICPASLMEIGQIASVLKENNQHIKYIFISIDPKRDTPEQLKNYFSSLPHIIALTGSKKQIQEVADLFKVYYSISLDGKQDTENYMVNHSSFFYLVDDKGEMVKIYPSGSRGIDIGYDILQRIKLNKDIQKTPAIPIRN